jgi:hypothetical protein
LSPVRVLMWPSEKCLEPCRSIAGGAAWILLTFPCFRKELGAIRRHGRTRGTIITCYWSNLDGTPVLFLHSLRQLARGRVMMYPCSVVGLRPRSGEAETSPEAEAWGRAKT